MTGRWLPACGTILFCALAIATGALAWDAWSRSSAKRTVAPPVERAATDALSAQETLRPPVALAEYNAVLTRPLFAPERRPVPPNIAADDAQTTMAVAENKQPDILPQVALHGVVQNGSSTFALLTTETSEPDWYGENAIIEGWTLKQIGADSVLLQAGDTILRIDLYK